MAECLEFGIGIFSIAFVEINVFLPSFFKMKYTPYSHLLKTKQAATKKNNKNHPKKPTKQTKAFRWHNLPNSCCKEFAIQKPHPCLLPPEKPSNTKKQSYDSGGQRYCSVAKCLCNSEEETEDQILASTSSINNYEDGSLLNG